MIVDVIIADDGSVVLSVDNTEGLTFEEAKAKLEDVRERLGAAGAPIVFEGDVERHVHPHEEGRVHSHGGQTHTHNH